MKFIFSSIEANQTSETADNPPATYAIMFPYKFLVVAGTAMEEKLNKVQLSSMSAAGSKWVASS